MGPNKDCFAYIAKEGNKLGDSCAALRELCCKKGKCKFYKPKEGVAEASEESIFIELPKEEYIQVRTNGRQVTVCTLRQKALHTIGLDRNHTGLRLYTRHGKKYYKPYRNYFSGNDKDLDKLVDAGYMDCVQDSEFKTKDYRFNRTGLDWLGEQLGIVIYDEEN